MSTHSFRVDIAVAAAAAARERASVAEMAHRRVIAGAIAVMRAEGLSDRKIAAELGVSKSSIKALSAPPEPTSELRHDVARLAQQVWIDRADLADGRYVVDGEDKPSFERMATHGIEPMILPGCGQTDTTSREYVQMASGHRILVYSQTRWTGLPDPTTESGWDYRGSYIVERCPALVDRSCGETHTPLPLGELGLAPGDEQYGTGWGSRRPTAYQVWRLLTATIEEHFEVFDPSYPEYELRRRVGTTPRYPARPVRADEQTSDADTHIER